MYAKYLSGILEICEVYLHIHIIILVVLEARMDSLKEFVDLERRMVLRLCLIKDLARYDSVFCLEKKKEIIVSINDFKGFLNVKLSAKA